MVSQASWQTGGVGRYGNAPAADGPMDRQSVESLLRRLVRRVEESERRYSEAFDELHARLDQLSQTTDAARAAGAPEDSGTFDRLHDQLSSLARRLEQEAPTPLDDFERLGKALAGNLDYGAGQPDTVPSTLNLTGAFPFPTPEPAASEPPGPFNFPLPDLGYSAPPYSPSLPSRDDDAAKRLVEMAQQLEHSIGQTLPPAALDALNARLDAIGRDLAKALETPKTLSLEPVERQISEMAQQLGRVEAQLAKIGEIEAALHQLIERVDASPSPEEVANHAAQEAARLVAKETKLDTATVERLDAMHRDLVAMSDRSKSNDDRLAGNIEAVHASLKQLVQQAERSATPASPAPSSGPTQAVPSAAPAAAATAGSATKPRSPFAERMRNLAPLPGGTDREDEAAKDAESADAKDASAKTGSGAASQESIETEASPRFGRGRRAPLGEQAFDLDAPTPRRAPAKNEIDAEYEIPEDLIAAARRAAQAAALKAEERGGGSRTRWLPGDADVSTASELPSHRKRSFLIICAAALLAISALLLYGRLWSKPEPEIAPPAAGQTAPAPSANEGAAAPGAGKDAPAAIEPNTEWQTVPDSGGAEQQSGTETSPAAGGAADAGALRNFTDVAKSPRQEPDDDDMPTQAQPASLKSDVPALPPGVVISVEAPAAGGAQPPAPASMPMSLPLPPPDLGPLALRQAAAEGDARAQYAIARRYALGQDTAQDLTEAAHWLQRAASAGLAPAQYRLAVLYERGQGVTKDLGRARSWYQAAAEKGNVKAMHNFAVSASGREGGGADYALAARWYGEAAAYGLADSQFNLGILAEHGLGMPANLGEAYKWFALAAKNGDEEAAKRRDAISLKLDAAALAAADQAIAAWTAKEASAEANEVEEPQEWADASSAIDTALVNRAQTLLNKLGYDVGVPDGLMGARTRDAIESFERRNGLEETGRVTIPLVAKLERLTS